jgi:hypothetical protein
VNFCFVILNAKNAKFAKSLFFFAFACPLFFEGRAPRGSFFHFEKAKQARRKSEFA